MSCGCKTKGKFRTTYTRCEVEYAQSKCFFDATIELHGIDRKGMLLDISKVISEQLGINMRNVTLKTDNGIVVAV